MLPQYHTPPPSHYQMSRSAAVRNLWINFEHWLGAPRGAAEMRRTEVLRTLHDDFLKNKRTTAESFHPMLLQAYENDKAQLNRHLDEELVHLAQLEWERRLTQAGLKAEEWIDMTPEERHSVERLLGGDLEDEEFTIIDSAAEGLASTSMAGVQSQAPITQAQPIAHGPPYAFVSPQTFGEEEDGGEDYTDEDGPSFDAFFPVDTWMRDGSTDRQADAQRAAAAFTQWATEAAAGGSPERSPPQNDPTPRTTARVPATHVPTAPPRKPAQPTARAPPIASTSSAHARTQVQAPQPAPNASLSQTTAPDALPDTRPSKLRAPGPQYVGPILHDPHDTKTEEAEFETYKVDTRVRKIWEFHFEAAELDARLARTLCDRRLDKVDVRRHIAEHERAVENLRLLKEDERKTIVELERSKRVAEISRRGALLSANPDQRHVWEAMIGQTSQADQRGGPKPSREAGRKPAAEAAAAAALDVLASFGGLQTQNTMPSSAEREERRHGQHPEAQAPGASRTASDSAPSSRSQRSQDAQPQKTAPTAHQKQPSRSSEKGKDPFASFPPAQNPAERKTDSREAAAVPVRQRRESEVARKGGVSVVSGFHDPQGSSRASGGGEARRPAQAAAGVVASTSRTTLDPVSSSNPHRAQEIWTPAGMDAHASGAAKRGAGTSKAVADSASKVKLPQDQAEWTAVDWRAAGREESRDPVETKQSRGAKAKISTIQLPPVTSPVLDTESVAGRLRRASDPPSPSPKLFAVQKQKSGPANMESAARPKPAGILKKQAQAPTRTRKTVTVEEVPDEDDTWELGGKGTHRKNAGDRPADANTIIEPRPSIPSASFAHIFQYGADEATVPPVANAGGSNVRKKSEPPPPADDWNQRESTTDSEGRRDVPLPAEESTSKAKHVRWTPSVVNDSPSSTPMSLDDEQGILSTFGAFGWNPSAGDDLALAPQASTSAQTVQPRNRVPSLVQPAEAPPAPAPSEIWQPGKQKRNEKKGKGKGKGKAKASGAGTGTGAGAGAGAGEQASEGPQDDLEWFAREAIENLKQQRSKPASAV